MTNRHKEKLKGCGPVCPHRIDRPGELNGPACGYYNALRSVAEDKK
jgi:hypothetical protein